MTVFASAGERLGRAQQTEGPTLGRPAPPTLGEISDAPKLTGPPSLLEPRPGTRLEAFSWVGPSRGRPPSTFSPPRPRERTWPFERGAPGSWPD